MDIHTIIEAATGQFGALTLACIVLYQMMQYHKENIDRLYADHREDRELYRTTLTDLSKKIDQIGDDVAEIKKGL